MARYKVLEKSFINDRIVEEGDEIDYDPPEGTEVSENLECLDPPAPSGRAKAAE